MSIKMKSLWCLVWRPLWYLWWRRWIAEPVSVGDGSQETVASDSPHPSLALVAYGLNIPDSSVAVVVWHSYWHWCIWVDIPFSSEAIVMSQTLQRPTWNWMLLQAYVHIHAPPPLLTFMPHAILMGATQRVETAFFWLKRQKVLFCTVNADLLDMVESCIYYESIWPVTLRLGHWDFQTPSPYKKSCRIFQSLSVFPLFFLFFSLSVIQCRTDF